MKITHSYLVNDKLTDDPNTANQLQIRANDIRIMTLARATHPLFGVQGYTLTPHPKDPNTRLRRGYETSRFKGSYLDVTIQNKLWVDPAMDQSPDITRDPAQWGTIDDLKATLRPLLKDH